MLDFEVFRSLGVRRPSGTKDVICPLSLVRLLGLFSRYESCGGFENGIARSVIEFGDWRLGSGL